MDLDNLSIVELKALVYDNLLQIEKCQMNAKIVNDKIKEKTALEKPNV